MKKEKERDYDTVIAKVPRKDKNGNDITSEKLDKGGRRRKDGTVAAMAYDIKVLDKEYDAVENQDDYPLEPDNNSQSRQELNAALEEAAIRLGIFIVDYLVEHPEVVEGIGRRAKQIVSTAKKKAVEIYSLVSKKEKNDESLVANTQNDVKTTRKDSIDNEEEVEYVVQTINAFPPNA